VPSNLASKQTLYGQSVQLSPKGLDDLEKASSGELQSELNTLINSQAYQSMEDEDKADEIQKKVTAIRRKYKKELAPMLVAGGMESSFEESDDGVKGVRNVFKLVGRYAQGMIKDPENALKAMFTEEHLRKIVGNAVILERKDLLALLDQGDKNTHVDHIVPLSLGGTNDSSNLRIVPAEENILKSKYERELLNLLKSGAITKKVAERRIMDWLESRPNQYPHL